MKNLYYLCLALSATSSFAYVGSVPISPQNINTNQVDNLKSSMSPKVRVYNDSSEPVNVQVYDVDSNPAWHNWDYASSWQPSKGYSVDMKDRHAELVPAHSWIDLYSTDDSDFDRPVIKYDVYGWKVKSDGPISFTFANISDSALGGRFQPMSFYYGWDSNYKKAVRFNISTDGYNGYYKLYYPSLCTALVITDTSAVMAPNLNRDTCDFTQAKSADMFTLY